MIRGGWLPFILAGVLAVACAAPAAPPAATSAGAPSKPASAATAPSGSAAAGGATNPAMGASAGSAGSAASAASTPSGASSAATTTPPTAPEAIRVAIPGRSFGYLPFFVAIRKGFFAEEGLDPLEITVVSGDLQPAALQVGEIDYAGAGGTIARAAAQGLPLKVILFLYERPTWSLVSRPDVPSGVQLRGKTVGVTRVGTSDDIALRLATARLGLNADTDVTPVSIGVQVMQGLLGGAVDAAIVNADATAIATAQGYHELVALADVAIWPFSGFGVSDTKLAQQRAQVKRYARAQVRGLQFMLDHEPEVAQIAVDELQMAPDIARLAVANALKSVSRTNPGGIDAEGTARFIEAELRPALPPGTEVQPSQFFDFSVVEEAQRELGLRR